MRRISSVNHIKVHSVAFSSTLEIGDTKQLTPYSKAIAVQREFPLFFSDEGSFNEYEIFTLKIPRPYVYEDIAINRINEKPVIHVNSIYVLGVSAASIMQIGSTDFIDAEARVKHIRQLLPDDKEEE